MNKQPFWNRIPLSVLIGIWLFAVVIGGILVYSVFFNKPSSPATRPAAVTAKPSPIANQPAANTNPTPAPPKDEPAPTLVPTQVITPTLSPMVDPAFGFGIQDDYLTGDIEATLKQVTRLRMSWIKQQMRWGVFSPAPGQMDWSGFDSVINAASDKGLKVMLSIVTAPKWSHPNLQATADDPDAINAPPDDLNEYAKFVGEVVDRYKGKIHAIEIWNEQNIDAEWRADPQSVNPEKYVEMLKLAYQTIKAKDPNIVVISGALSPTGYFQGGCSAQGCDDGPYLKRMTDAGFLQYADCVGVHANGINFPPDKTYNEGYNDPTAKYRGPFSNPHPSWSFRSTLELYHDTVQSQKPLCVTEFGWPTSEGFNYTKPGYEYAADNTLDEQAKWIADAFQLMQDWKYVKMAFLFNLYMAQKSPDGVQDRAAAWSIMDQNGVARPAFEALRLYMKKVRGQ